MNKFTKLMMNTSISTSIISLGIMVYLFNGDFAYSLAIAALSATVICLTLAWISLFPIFNRTSIKGSKKGIFNVGKIENKYGTSSSGKSSDINDKAMRKSESSILPISSSESSTSSDSSWPSGAD